MAQKLAQDKGDERDIKEAVERARPMSVLSDKFFRQGVAKVEGVLMEMNEEVLPNLPLKKEKIAKELSLFVDWSGKNVEMDLLGLYSHGRVLSFNLAFSDKYGNIYNYISVKGLGMPERSEVAERRNEPIEKDEKKGAWGLQEYWGAKAEWEASNEFLKNGIQTSVPIAIIRLDSITLRGERKSVKELKEQGIIPQNIEYDDELHDYQPVIYLVGFSEMMRIRDARRDDYEQFADSHKMKFQEYVKWWSDKLAVNIAKLHNLGKVHTYMTDHNLTLDGCFVDNDGVRDLGKPEKTLGREREITDVLFQIPIFFAETREDVKTAADMRKCRMDFLRKYLENRENLEKKGLWDLRYELTLTGLNEEIKVVEEVYEKKFGNKMLDDL